MNYIIDTLSRLNHYLCDVDFLAQNNRIFQLSTSHLEKMGTNIFAPWHDFEWFEFKLFSWKPMKMKIIAFSTIHVALKCIN
jgi:hypothetical protein